ncbi:CD63 antigen-like [Penaeus monodon]|uniref:CD63 antigen-like n=1 Tax=Penaeus monodon TaxID=6687 RepID=UPI0018A70759|nr:CD63 antigen-like [Penaeus monodon]
MAESNLGCGPLTIKYLVFIFNFIFFLSGIILIAVGVVAQIFFSSYLQFFDGKFETPAIGIIILGAIILVVSFFGCCGAKKENVCMLRTFSFLMVVVLLCEIAAGITVAVMRPQVEELVKKNMDDTMDQYGSPKNLVTKTWDDLQKNYHCCGTNNYTEWEITPFGKNVTGVPDTCCKIITAGCGHGVFSGNKTETIFTDGCYTALNDSAMRNIGAIIGGAVALALLQMVGVWMSHCLVRAVKERYEIL